MSNEAVFLDPFNLGDLDFTVLEQLAALAERARAAQPHGASPGAVESAAEEAATPIVEAAPLNTEEASPVAEAPRPSGLLPASDRVSDVAIASLGRRYGRIILIALGVAAILLIGFVVWLGWRGPKESDSKAQAAAPSTTVATAPVAVAQIPSANSEGKANPEAESVSPSSRKNSGKTAAKPSANLDKALEKKTPADKPLLTAEATHVALPVTALGRESKADSNSPGAASAEKTNSDETPTIAIAQSSPAALEGVLSAKASVPALSAPISQGVSGGKILHQVSPGYPVQAKSFGLEGKVVLNATVAEDDARSSGACASRRGRREAVAVPAFYARWETHQGRDCDHN
jgi:hypothetical protein